MKRTSYFNYICLLLCMLWQLSYAQAPKPQQLEQDRMLELQAQLDTLALTEAGLNATMNFSFSGLSIKELFREIGRRSKLNLDIDKSIEFKVINNFSNIEVKNILLYLCKQYHLEIEFTGSILYIKPHKVITVVKKKPLLISKNDKGFSLNLKADTLSQVAQLLTDLSNTNIIVKPKLVDQTVSLYIKDLDLYSAIEKLCIANGITSERLDDGSLVLSQVVQQKNKGNASKRGSNRRASNSSKQVRIEINTNDTTRFDIEANGVDLEGFVYRLFERAGVNYLIHSKLEGELNMQLEQANLEQVLDAISTNSKYAYRKIDEGTYSFGERQQEGIRDNVVIPVKYRQVEGLLAAFPGSISKDLEVKEHPELNSFILSGADKNINEFIQFLAQIDKPVPVILIDVIVVDYSTTKGLETGISIGNKTEPTTSSGGLYPNFDYNFGANSVNNLLSSFTSFGALNLGGVNPNFFVSLKALESNGIIDIQSTPKLSAMNGQEATFVNGKEEYYLVEQTNTIGTQNPSFQTNQNWQSTKASLEITVKPTVSLSGEVTLEVSFNQTSFTGRIAPTAPPGTATRALTSTIRVQDGDMILLGGLEELSKNDTGQGIPLLSRIPILKWFFSSRQKSSRKSKLHVFIKPTVLY